MKNLPTVILQETAIRILNEVGLFAKDLPRKRKSLYIVPPLFKSLLGFRGILVIKKATEHAYTVEEINEVQS